MIKCSVFCDPSLKRREQNATGKATPSEQERRIGPLQSQRLRRFSGREKVTTPSYYRGRFTVGTSQTTIRKNTEDRISPSARVLSSKIRRLNWQPLTTGGRPHSSKSKFCAREALPFYHQHRLMEASLTLRFACAMQALVSISGDPWVNKIDRYRRGYRPLT
jgi:hypothetical protein